MYQQNKQEFWAGKIELWQASGKSQKAFCLEQDLAYPTFMYWQRKILQRTYPQHEALSVVEIAVDSRSNPLLDAQNYSLTLRELELQLGSASLRISGQISIGNLARLASLCQETNHAQA